MVKHTANTMAKVNPIRKSLKIFVFSLLGCNVSEVCFSSLFFILPSRNQVSRGSNRPPHQFESSGKSFRYRIKWLGIPLWKWVQKSSPRINIVTMPVPRILGRFKSIPVIFSEFNILRVVYGVQFCLTVSGLGCYWGIESTERCAMTIHFWTNVNETPTAQIK